MKKLIALLLVLGLSMPSMAAVGENEDDNVKCENIFNGNENKIVGEGNPADKNPNPTTIDK